MDGSTLMNQRTLSTMGTRVALDHTTIYTYDRAVTLGPHVVRLSPAPHCRTHVTDYSLAISPDDYLIHWQFDLGGNRLARVLFNQDVSQVVFQVNLSAELQSINPFDFFLEPDVARFPFTYESDLHEQLIPYRLTTPAGPRLSEFLASINVSLQDTITFLVELNQRLADHVEYVVRMQPGIQSSEKTLELGQGSCRDSAVLLMQVLRHLGFAARFTSGYLIQLKADEAMGGDRDGPREDGAELHAWTEVYLPGAGWIGLDATSGMLAAEGHIPLASASHPDLAAPISGTAEQSAAQFQYSMSVSRT